MNVDYLREFIETAMCLNLSKAAKTMHVSQPSLSKHISALEAECGATLLKRTTSRVELTSAGQTLFEEALRLISLHDETLQKVRMQKDVTLINIGGLCNNSEIISLVNTSVAQVNASAPHIQPSYQNYRTSTYSQQLLDKKIDVAFTILDDSDVLEDELCSVRLFSDPLICLVKESHELYPCTTVHVRDLAGVTILQPVGSYSTEHGRSTVRGIFARHGINPVQKPVFVHSISELSYVANEQDVLIMERTMLGTQPFTSDYKAIDFYEEDACFVFYAVFREDDDRPDVHAFIDALVEGAQRVEQSRIGGLDGNGGLVAFDSFSRACLQRSQK